MRRLGLLLVLAGASTGLTSAQSNRPVVVAPESIQWSGSPAFPGLKSAWVLGGESTPGPYIFRVKIPANGRIPPHTHPDERSTTVLSGTIYVGFGEAFDESRVIAVPAGGVYVAPASVPHFVWAKDGDAEYQEVGIGPTRTAIVKR